MDKHMTIDFETLGRGDNAPIVQMAAVVWDVTGVLDTWKMNVELQSLDPKGIDMSTLDWWFKQQPAAIDSVFGSIPRESICHAIQTLEDLISHHNPDCIWQHSSFDAPKFQHAVRRYLKRETRVPYWVWKDIRSLTYVTGVEKTKVAGIAHDALHDCLNQAEYVNKALLVCPHLK